MNIPRVLGNLLLIIGIALLILGIIATQKVGQQVAGDVTGHFSSKTVWYILGGLAMSVLGGWLMRYKIRS